MARKERDVIGEVELPDNVYYGVNTFRAMNNFRISGIVEDYVYCGYGIFYRCLSVIHIDSGWAHT